MIYDVGYGDLFNTGVSLKFLHVSCQFVAVGENESQFGNFAPPPFEH